MLPEKELVIQHKITRYYLKIALDIFKNEKTEKQGVKRRRPKAAWDHRCFLKV
jgi:hypothetical protein